MEYKTIIYTTNSPTNDSNLILCEKSLLAQSQLTKLVINGLELTKK